MLVGPGRFHKHAAQVGIAGFGDAAALDAIAAGELAGHQAAVAHQLPGLFKSGQGAHLGDDAYRSDLGHATQSLQGLNDGAHFRRSLGDHFINGLLQPLDPFGHVTHFVDMHPAKGRLFHVVVAPAVTQQEFAQAVPGAMLILPGIFARSHQVPQRFMRGVGNPHRREVASTITARQFRRISAICLHPIAGFDRHQRGAITAHGTPSVVSCQYSTYPVGPAS